MAIMRVEKNSNYTVMANYHLKDRRLSLKAKGLMSVMLSLPADWDYTLAGLAHISREGIDAVRAAVRELERAGYIHRARQRNGAGQLTDTEYTIYEYPREIKTEEAQKRETTVPPVAEQPALGNPTLDLPTPELPAQAKPMQSSKKEIKTPTTSNPYPSYQHDRVPADAISFRQHLSSAELEEQIKSQIDYDSLIENCDKEEIDNILAIMTEVVSADCETFTISGKRYPADLVLQRYSQNDHSTIRYVLECLHKCGSDIRNIKQYLIATLFNAPATCESYYGAAVRRDLPCMRN